MKGKKTHPFTKYDNKGSFKKPFNKPGMVKIQRTGMFASDSLSSMAMAQAYPMPVSRVSLGGAVG